MNTHIVLSQSDSRPMYQQIVDQVTQRIAVGDWIEGTKLPSIRELAIELGVSVITVKRAYLELERAGSIVTQQGKGSWVAEGSSRHELQRHELQRLLAEVARLTAAMGIDSDDLVDRLTAETKPQENPQ